MKEAVILHVQPGLQGTLEPDLGGESREKKSQLKFQHLSVSILLSLLSQYSPFFLPSSPLICPLLLNLLDSSP